jgi:hypothetical protein
MDHHREGQLGVVAAQQSHCRRIAVRVQQDPQPYDLCRPPDELFLCVSQQAEKTNAVDQTVNGAIQAAFGFINSALICIGRRFWLFQARLRMHALAQAQLCGVGIAMQTVPVKS